MATENTSLTSNPSDRERRPKVVVITGPTGSGKSKLAVDLASHFPLEVINADSMQVYRGLDVLTNKLPFSDQNGVPHHLLGTVSPNLEFTAKSFRDSAIPIIDAILARNHLPVIVGGTNYYIQALVSSFLLDDSADDLNESYLGDSPGITQSDDSFAAENDSSHISYDLLKDIDPVAANRIHPNNHRKINQYISLYSRTGVLPSKVFQGKAAEKWGQADNLRYDCCFICVDTSLPVLDRYVEQRVDCMMDAGLLNEVYDIYTSNADYTRGLRQAIGVREFEPLLTTCVVDNINCSKKELTDGSSLEKGEPSLNGNLMERLRSLSDAKSLTLLEEAIEKVKVNTRRLVRRQKRMLNRLQTLFGWNIHYVDSTESILSKSNDVWTSQVVESATLIVKSFLSENGSLLSTSGMSNDTGTKIIQRDLWTQYTCKVCHLVSTWHGTPFHFTKRNALFCLITLESHLIIRERKNGVILMAGYLLQTNAFEVLELFYTPNCNQLTTVKFKGIKFLNYHIKVYQKFTFGCSKLFCLKFTGFWHTECAMCDTH